jgi:hypothetical protein
MAVVLGIHLLDILQEVHAVFPSIIEPANERQDIDRFLCVLCRSVRPPPPPALGKNRG